MERIMIFHPTISLVIMFPPSSSFIHRLVSNTLVHRRIIKEIIVVTNNKKIVSGVRGRNNKSPAHYIYSEKNRNLTHYRDLIEKRAIGTYVLYLDPTKAYDKAFIEKQIRRIESVESVFQNHLTPSIKIFDDQKIASDYWELLSGYRDIKNSKVYRIGYLLWRLKKAINLQHLFYKKNL